MILSFVNRHKVPREMLKLSGFALGFHHLPRELSNVSEWKIMFDPYIVYLDNWDGMGNCNDVRSPGIIRTPNCMIVTVGVD